MKIVWTSIVLLLMAGCSHHDDDLNIRQGIAECNTACVNNPNVKTYSVKAAGGIPILFFGGMEQKCGCRQTNSGKVGE